MLHDDVRSQLVDDLRRFDADETTLEVQWARGGVARVADGRRRGGDAGGSSSKEALSPVGPPAALLPLPLP